VLHRPPVRALLALPVLAVLTAGSALALAQTAAPPPVVSYTLGKPGSLPAGPATVGAGATRFDVSTTAKGNHSFELLRVAPGADVAAVQARLRPIRTPNQLEAIKELTAIGGTSVSARTKGTAVFSLEPGTYLFTDSSASRVAPSIPVTVAGDPATAPLPAATTTLNLRDYRFELAGTLPRDGDVRVQNRGKRNHIVLTFRTRNAASSARVVKALKAGDDRAAGREITGEGPNVNVIGPGQTQDLRFTAKPGPYVFVCFWGSKQSRNKQHSRLGMVKAVTVK
jgi:hypothetical protein